MTAQGFTASLWGPDPQLDNFSQANASPHLVPKVCSPTPSRPIPLC